MGPAAKGEEAAAGRVARVVAAAREVAVKEVAARVAERVAERAVAARVAAQVAARVVERVVGRRDFGERWATLPVAEEVDGAVKLMRR